jgi:hypothetical protein
MPEKCDDCDCFCSAEPEFELPPLTEEDVRIIAWVMGVMFVVGLAFWGGVAYAVYRLGAAFGAW